MNKSLILSSQLGFSHYRMRKPKLSTIQLARPYSHPLLQFHPYSIGEMSGFFLFDAVGSVASVVGSVVSKIASTIAHVVSFLASSIFKALKNPLRFVGFIWKGMADVATLGPLFRWKVTRGIAGKLDYFTGGLFTTVHNVSEIPGRAASGEKITRQDALSALSLAMEVGVIVASGGSAGAFIGMASSQLQAGPLGRTVLGRQLLTIGAFAAGVATGPGSFTQNLMSQGEKTAIGAGSSIALNKTPLGKSVVGQVAVGAGAGLASGQSVSNIAIGQGSNVLLNTTPLGQSVIGQTAVKGAAGYAQGESLSDVGVSSAQNVAVSAISKANPTIGDIAKVTTSTPGSILDKIEAAPSALVSALKNLSPDSLSNISVQDLVKYGKEGLELASNIFGGNTAQAAQNAVVSQGGVSAVNQTLNTLPLPLNKMDFGSLIPFIVGIGAAILIAAAVQPRKSQ